MIPVIPFIIWLTLHQVNLSEGYAFEKYYNTTEFINFYKSISLSSGKYNNIFLINELFERLDYDSNVSEPCLSELTIFRDSIMNSSELWPLMMLDASGGFHAGLFQGNVIHLGDWSQCISISSPYLKTTHCQAKISLPLGPVQNYSSPYHNAPIIFNLCLPSNCGEMELELLLTESFRPRNLTVDLECTHEYTFSSSYVIIVVMTVILLLSGSTIFQFFFSESDSKLKIMNLFAIQCNWKVLFSTTPDKTLSCLFGIKFITQFVVIWYHLVLKNLSIFQPFINKFKLSEVVESWQGSYYMSLTLSVDTYLLMSGLLVSYTSIGKSSKYRNLFQYYLHRYIRLTPSVLVVLLTYIFASNLMCTGPQCSSVKAEEENCQKYWWFNLLYINNYYPTFMKTCVYQCWYLALDFQLYLLSPVLLYLISVSRKTTSYAILLLLLLVAFIMPAIYTYIYEVPSEEFYLYREDDIDKFYQKYYTPLETRFGPWIVGFIIGMMIKQDDMKFIYSNSWFSGTGWLLSGVLMAACLIINVPHLHMEQENIIVNVIYNGLKKNLWGISIGWIIWSCSRGNAGPVNMFLSWKPFEPLSKLSYGAYLIHRAIINVFVLNTRTPLYYSYLYQAITLGGVVAVTYIFSLILYLSVEAPFCNFDRLIFSGKAAKRQETHNNLVNKKKTEAKESDLK